MTLLLPAYAEALTPKAGNVYCMDCFDLMARLEPASVDAIITDMPYGTTACAWDTVVDLPRWWAAVKRVLKPRSALVTTASQPFTSALVMSAPEMFKYAWVWDKKTPVGHLNANRMPLRTHEDVLVFCEHVPSYYPQMIKRPEPRVWKQSRKVYGGDGKAAYRKFVAGGETVYEERFPVSVMSISAGHHYHRTHPTQKPVALYEYLIKTYTQPGEVVLDPFAGSGTTAIACLNTGRQFIAGDFTAAYVEIARRRVANWKREGDMEVSPGVTQLGLFANTA